MNSPLSTDEVEAFAERLLSASDEARAVPMLSIARPFTVVDAYLVQRAGVAQRRLRGDELVGMKMGLTSHAKMVQVGVHEPIYGHLTSSMALVDGGSIDRRGHIHPRVEPEIAFCLKRDLRGPTTPAQALDAVDWCCAALELIDSRYQDFKFNLADVVADNASSSRFVLGSVRQPASFDVGNLGMVLSKNGAVVELGSSAAILDHPARSLAALQNMLVAVGEHLKAGMIVLSGGATAAIPLEPGDHARVAVQGLGTVDVFVDASADRARQEVRS